MVEISFERLVKSSRLAMSAIDKTELIVDRSIRITRPDRERLEGKVKKSGGASGGSGNAEKLVKQLSDRLKTKAPRKPTTATTGRRAMAFDARQRAVMKIHYFPHASDPGSALKAHVKYVARDAAVRDGPPIELQDDSKARRDHHRRHAEYLEADVKRGRFYGPDARGIDGAAVAEAWARSDRRHFRLILSAEEGARLKDLAAYTREVMARAGAALGTKLSWVAVDHYDTDNPHTHIILRGRRANGQDLWLPPDFIKHGFRSITRDVATEWLGARTPAQERAALERDTRWHGLSRLDPMIAAQAKLNVIRLADLQAANGDPRLTQALKARTRELERLGLAQELGRNVFRFSADWRERLKDMELHLDIRKAVMQSRAIENTRAIERLSATRPTTRGIGPDR